MPRHSSSTTPVVKNSQVNRITFITMNSRKHSHPWFKETFGFEECSYNETKQHFKLSSDGTELTSLRNNRKFHVGLFEVLSHKDLHARKVKLKDGAGIS